MLFFLFYFRFHIVLDSVHLQYLSHTIPFLIILFYFVDFYFSKSTQFHFIVSSFYFILFSSLFFSLFLFFWCPVSCQTLVVRNQTPAQSRRLDEVKKATFPLSAAKLAFCFLGFGGLLPKIIGDLPKYIGDLPKRIGNLPKNIGNLPRRIGDLPRKIGQLPRLRMVGTEDALFRSIEAMQASSKKPWYVRSV